MCKPDRVVDAEASLPLLRLVDALNGSSTRLPLATMGEPSIAAARDARVELLQ